MNGTQQQEEIWNAIENDIGHVFVYAGAGCGKTTTIVEGANRADGEKMAFFAFNKSIADELRERLPENVQASTFHSFGNSTIRRTFKGAKMDKWKVPNILKEMFGDDFPRFEGSKVVGLVKGSMIDASDSIAVRNIIDEYNITFENASEEKLLIKRMPQILEKCMTLEKIDFDDMIWLPLVMNLPMEHFDMVFVDEAQDFNEAQRQMIVRAVNGGRCIVVGDPNQAIYGFRGADSSSMDIFKSQLQVKGTPVSEYPLSKTFRCPPVVVEVANRYVEELSPFFIDKEGEFRTNQVLDPKPDDLVLCRLNAPLISTFYDLIARGKTAYILGRDMGKGLSSYVKKVTENNRMSIPQFLERLHRVFKSEYDDYVNAGRDAKALALEDKVRCVQTIASRCSTVQGLHDEIDGIFGRDAPKTGAILSTVHKSKGLEAETVWIIAPDKMPHPMGNPVEERNIQYVAVTRAMSNLYVCGAW